METIDINKGSYETRVVYKQINDMQIKHIIGIFKHVPNKNLVDAQINKFNDILNKLDKLFNSMKDARDEMGVEYKNATTEFDNYLVDCPYLVSSINTYRLIKVLEDIKNNKNHKNHVSLVKSTITNKKSSINDSYENNTLIQYTNNVISIISALSLLLDHLSSIDINRKNKIIIIQKKKSIKPQIDITLNDKTCTEQCDKCGFTKGCYCHIIEPHTMEPCTLNKLITNFDDIIEMYVYMYKIYNTTNPCKEINKYFTHGEIVETSDMNLSNDKIVDYRDAIQ